MVCSIVAQVFWISILILNVVTFFVFGIDKFKAKKSLWRIPESTLLILAAVGGSVGAYLGMKVWHHKTLHKKFSLGVPAILLLHLALLVYIMNSSS